MTTIRFNDGMSFDTSGEYRTTRRSDGLYVVGHGMLIPVADYDEANTLIAELKGARATRTTAQNWRP